MRVFASLLHSVHILTKDPVHLVYDPTLELVRRHGVLHILENLVCFLAYEHRAALAWLVLEEGIGPVGYELFDLWRGLNERFHYLCLMARLT